MPSDFSALGGFEDDPRQVVFSLARYKWVAKMLHGKSTVLEVGCADGWKSRIVRQAVGHVIGIDRDPVLIDAARENASERWPITFTCQSALSPLPAVDAVYCLDVFEHIPPYAEVALLQNLRDCADVCIIGTPSLESQAYASKESKADHVNCISGEALRARCKRYWREVFMFSGHDETIVSAYLPMAHYLLALCVK